MKETRRIAYIDLENISVSELEEVIARIKESNVSVEMRAYGSNLFLGAKLEILKKHNIKFFDTVEMASSRKKLADMVITVECMQDVMSDASIQTVYLFSKDTDFVPLVCKLKEFGVRAYTLIGREDALKNHVGLIVKELRNKNMWPIVNTAIDVNLFDYTKACLDGKYSDEDICAFVQYRQDALVRKTTTILTACEQHAVQNIPAREFSFDAFHKVVKSLDFTASRYVFARFVFGVSPPLNRNWNGPLVFIGKWTIFVFYT